MRYIGEVSQDREVIVAISKRHWDILSDAAFALTGIQLELGEGASGDHYREAWLALMVFLEPIGLPLQRSKYNWKWKVKRKTTFELIKEENND